MLFSEILATTNNPNSLLSTVSNQNIEFDELKYDLLSAYRFINCSFTLHQGTNTPLISISAYQGLRFESCTFYSGVCIWGQPGMIQDHAGATAGPNIFIEQCKAEPFMLSLLEGQPQIEWKPKIQISGLISHSRVQSAVDKPFELSISQCIFTRLDIEGSFSNLGISASQGKEIYFKNLNYSYLWLSDQLVTFSSKQHFDNVSIDNLSERSDSLKIDTPDHFTNIRSILESLMANKSNNQFTKLNNSLGSYIFRIYWKHPWKNRKLFFRYGIFNNFYSLSPWLYIALTTLLIFTGVYCLFGVDYRNAFQDSIFSFSGNPPRDLQRSFTLNTLNAIEAYIGLFYLLIVSFVFGRIYTHYD